MVEVLEEVVSGESLAARPQMMRLLDLVSTGTPTCLSKSPKYAGSTTFIKAGNTTLFIKTSVFLSTKALSHGIMVEIIHGRGLVPCLNN